MKNHWLKFRRNRCNRRFLQEAIDIEKVWRKNGTLAMFEKFSRAQVAKMMEGQRLSNEQPKEKSCQYHGES